MIVPVEVMVTPEVARRWLASSLQTSTDEHRLERLRAALTSGSWNADRHRPDPVKLYRGELINGNHRLRAVLDTGLAASMWVQFVPEKEPVDVADG